jgi:hypothetical protein
MSDKPLKVAFIRYNLDEPLAVMEMKRDLASVDMHIFISDFGEYLRREFDGKPGGKVAEKIREEYFRMLYEEIPNFDELIY